MLSGSDMPNLTERPTPATTYSVTHGTCENVPRMTLRGGIDLGGTKVQAVVVGSDDVVVGSARQPTPTTGGPDDVAATMVRALPPTPKVRP